MERRLCFWSLLVLDRTCSSGSSIKCSLPVEDFYAKEDEHQLSTVYGSDFRPSFGQEDCVKDLGIYNHAVQILNVWGLVVEFILRPASTSLYPPWKSESEYAKIKSEVFEFETRCPDSYRYKNSHFLDKSSSELNANRTYWSPWIVVQIVYPTVLAILDHPFLCSTRLRQYFGRIPSTFLETSLESAIENPRSVLRTIKEASSKDFQITDPFIGYCVGVAASIFLHHSHSENKAFAEQSRGDFVFLLTWLEEMGHNWPNVQQIVSCSCHYTTDARYGSSAADSNHTRPKSSVN